MSELKRVTRAPQLRGSVRVPGDKSGSHRALMLSAMAAGESTIVGLSRGHDVESTSTIVRQLGAERFDDGDTVTILGPESGLMATDQPLDCGNSGTTMRLMAGIVSAIAGEHLLVGDDSLSRRPMDRVAEPLGLMGSRVSGQGERVHAPLRIEGVSRPKAISYHVPTASAQVKSAILLAGLSADGPTYVQEDVRTRSTTEDMMRHAGIEVTALDVLRGRSVELRPGRPLSQSWRVPGDPSQAAFFAVLGLVHPDAFVEVLDVDSSPERIGFVTVLQRMGGRIELLDDHGSTTLVSQTSQLVATEVHAHEIPSVDEVPVLAVAAAAAHGVSAFRDMGELRLKESDRFDGAMSLASSLGCRVWAEGDDFFVEGLGGSDRFLDFEVDADLDHRMVMASAVAGASGNGCAISGVATVASSYPDFFEDLDALR